jgi:DNA-binding MarR family transcriptional regulator
MRVEPDHARRHPGADKLATECVVNLIRAESLVARELDRIFRPHGLTNPSYNVLVILAGAGSPLSPYVIGERLLVTRGTVTGLLDSLERRGLVRRTPHPADRRMLLVELTEAARPLMRKVARDLLPAQAGMMAALSASEKETLVQLLGKVQNHLQGRVAPARTPAG